MYRLGRGWRLTLAKARCCWAWQFAWASSLATTFLRRASASSAAWIRSRSPICNTSVTFCSFSFAPCPFFLERQAGRCCFNCCKSYAMYVDKSVVMLTTFEHIPTDVRKHARQMKCRMATHTQTFLHETAWRQGRQSCKQHESIRWGIHAWPATK